VLTCEECGCVTGPARGWFAYIAEDPDGDEDPVVCTYCPPCAQRELDARPREPHYV
jgi:hypothetical protein